MYYMNNTCDNIKWKKRLLWLLLKFDGNNFCPKVCYKTNFALRGVSSYLLYWSKF